MMFVKRLTRNLTRMTLGAAMGGTLFIGACDAQALQVAGVGLDVAASLLDRGSLSGVGSIVDFFARL